MAFCYGRVEREPSPVALFPALALATCKLCDFGWITYSLSALVSSSSKYEVSPALAQTSL